MQKPAPKTCPDCDPGLSRRDFVRTVGAAALAAGGAPADIVPEAGFTTEALLEHPQLNLVAGLRVQIVRGVHCPSGVDAAGRRPCAPGDRSARGYNRGSHRGWQGRCW